jgi:hypothetical protein
MYDAYLSVDLGRQIDWTAIVVAEEARWVPEPPVLSPWGGSAALEEAFMWQGLDRYGWTPPSALTARQRAYFQSTNYYAGQRPDRPPLLIRHLERVRGRPYP